MSYVLSLDHDSESMSGDCENKEAARKVSKIDKQALRKACRRIGGYGVRSEPMRGKEGCRRRLYKICEQKVINQEDALIVSEVSRVVSPPKDESVGEP